MVWTIARIDAKGNEGVTNLCVECIRRGFRYRERVRRKGRAEPFSGRSVLNEGLSRHFREGKQEGKTEVCKFRAGLGYVYKASCPNS